MEAIVSTTRVKTTAKDENQEVDQRVLGSSKPLHRFIQREPKSLGVVLVIFGCAELLMGFHLPSEFRITSHGIYIPFWQGVLFLVCGNLSIYTEVHPSKKMVTVCLAMYMVSIFGIIVSLGYRIYCLVHLSNMAYYSLWRDEENNAWSSYRTAQLLGVECILFTSSLCVSALLIFLCTIARLALKSTRTQIIVHCIPPPPTDTTSN